MPDLSKINQFTNISPPKSSHYFLVSDYGEPIGILESQSISEAWKWVEKTYETEHPMDLGYTVIALPCHKTY